MDKTIKDQIKKLRAAYMDACGSESLTDIREYEAGVDLFAMQHDMKLSDAYVLIEEGEWV